MDSCYFEHAHSALNSFNNSKLQVTYSKFENNERGIHFRAYNPDKPLPDQNGYWYVAPSNAYVAGNTLKFTNSFVHNTQYISNPIGIQIDSVYKITIGDNASSTLLNVFDSLRYGIKGVNSLANVYNASFNQINQFNYQANIDYSVDNQNVPLEGAIHFSKAKWPANSIPASSQINKVIGNQYVTIGGDSGRTCTFNNCNFGIFAENVSIQIKNNTFTNQKYNAIYIKELFDSHIMNNEITMTGNYPNVDEVLKASIQIRNIQNVSNGRDVWILNNIINKPTVGISLLNNSSTANAATNKYVKIGGNQIYFDNINTTGGLNYCGIKVQNCDRIRIAGNIIESSFDPGNSENVKKLVGIHIAQSKET